MLDKGDKTVGSDSSTDLYPDCVLCGTPKLLDFKMLLEPLEELMRSLS